MPVDDRLRQAGRARREQHVQRVVEGQRVERKRPARSRAGRPTRQRPAARRPRHRRRERGRRCGARAARLAPPPPTGGGLRACRRTGSRRRANSTVGSSWPRRLSTLRGPNSAGRSPRPRQGWPQRGRRRASPGRSGGTRRRGRRARRRAPAGRRAPRATCSRRSPNVSSTGARVWECATTADEPESSSRPTMCSAQLISAPGNHSAPGISREPSTRSYGACVRISKKSQIAPQNASRSEIDQRWRSS